MAALIASVTSPWPGWRRAAMTNGTFMVDQAGPPGHCPNITGAFPSPAGAIAIPIVPSMSLCSLGKSAVNAAASGLLDGTLAACVGAAGGVPVAGFGAGLAEGWAALAGWLGEVVPFSLIAKTTPAATIITPATAPMMT